MTSELATQITAPGAPVDSPENILQALLMAMEAKDFKARRHSERVAEHALRIADRLELDEEERTHLRAGALLHDLGNIGIPDAILMKPGGLSPLEFDEMKLHPIIGEQICRPLLCLEPVLPLIRNHQEKLDGTGYPDGLRGEEISLLLRILSVTDVYDTLRSDRVYREAFDHEEAIAILQEEAVRGWWDAQIVQLLSELTAPQTDFAPV